MSYGLTHRQCPRCETTYEIIQDYLDDPCPNECQPVRNGSDLSYFRFHPFGKLYAWHPEEKTSIYVCDDGHIVEKPMDDYAFEQVMKVARNVPYAKVPTAFRAVVAGHWGVVVKKQSVRAI